MMLLTFFTSTLKYKINGEATSVDLKQGHKRFQIGVNFESDNQSQEDLDLLAHVFLSVK